MLTLFQQWEGTIHGFSVRGSKLFFDSEEREMVKKLFSTVLVCIALAVLAAPTHAVELWDPHLRGVNEGLAAGALPPPGLYFINNAYWANYHGHDNAGDKTDTKLNAFVDVPIILWNPGFKLLGADFGVALAQPFDYTDLRVPLGGGTYVGESNWGTYNTVLVPGIFAWSLPYDFHIAASLAVYLPDASSSPPTDRVVALSGNGYWTLEPGIGISWLHNGWNISADLHISCNFENPDSHYWTAPEFWADYTVTKTIGKWTFGVGAYQQNQIAKDELHGNSVPDSAVTNFGMGPILGYNFGPVIVTAMYNWGIITKNDVGGDWFNIRFVIPIPTGS
jgi:hypothetical protein